MRKIAIKAWNIRGCMTPAIRDALAAATDVDVFVLTEYKPLKAGDHVGRQLAEAGWSHTVRTKSPPGQRGAAVFSRLPLSEAWAAVQPGPDPTEDWRPWLAPARLRDSGLLIVGAYVPFRDGPLKEQVCATLAETLENRSEQLALVIGDFNSTRDFDADSGRAYTPHALDRLDNVGVDLWEAAHAKRDVPEREHITWQGSNGYGNRLDYAFGSRALAPYVTDVRHDHTLRERRVSDHSAIRLILELPGAVTA